MSPDGPSRSDEELELREDMAWVHGIQSGSGNWRSRRVCDYRQECRGSVKRGHRRSSLSLAVPNVQNAQEISRARGWPSPQLQKHVFPIGQSRENGRNASGLCHQRDNVAPLRPALVLRLLIKLLALAGDACQSAPRGTGTIRMRYSRSLPGNVDVEPRISRCWERKKSTWPPQLPH